MNTKKNKSRAKQSPKRRQDDSRSREFETMSQIQNRYGKGRAKSGSDGGSGNEGFSNH